MAKRTPSYTPSPAVSPEQLPRLTAVIEVLAGVTTVSAAARSLGLSRNHFQTILHRAVAAMLASLAMHSGGRPARDRERMKLQAQVAQLQRENRRLRTQVESSGQLLTVASGLLQGRIRRTGRQARRKAGSIGGEDNAEHDATERGRILEGVAAMRRLGVSSALAAGLAGVHLATLRRWRAATRDCGSCPLHRRASRTLACGPAIDCVRELVRRLHGLVGAESLRHSVAGISRRAAARVKAEMLTAMERERRAALTLRADIEANGAPLVYRLDRAAAHTAPAARALLDEHDVLLLQGPPHYPGFYGQLERQNREHRAWAAQLPALSREQIAPCLEQMRHGVNALWRRRSLQWHTAAEAWSARPPLEVDRQALRQEVHDRATHIARDIPPRGQPRDLAERLAIIQTLERMGYLRQEVGGWC